MTAVNLKVMTYNIHKGFSFANRKFVLHQMREQLQAADVDLVFLQEIQGEHKHHAAKLTGWPAESQFEFLADQLWPHYAYGKNALYDAGHHGNAILSKFPFVQWENINVSTLRFASRSLLHGIIDLPGVNRLHAICIHFDLLAHERRRQVNVLVERIHEHVPDSEPLILAGDFNDWRGQIGRQLQLDLGLVDAFRQLHGKQAVSFPAVLPFLPVDRIYYRGLELTDCQCLSGSPWGRLSDHLPLTAEFQPGDVA